ncbi:AraC family transcriptional regulator [Vibrio coralliilyticus]|uniref:AraC family transcriptional regulator n=1 Tax=Vibrio coralliilyticus TaxID=190893 RepID=UPI0006CC80E8|nr:helix-turn-helix transcriptional regulator [Vibrio coralliilyticus]AXN33848.1 AraC family transcriptional regulator [Vibrio coralliilyticus]KPH24610.1 AraC family transcriptional regulator [Vibrio coralliilyticus]
MLIDEHSVIDPDSIDSKVVGIAADLGRHDSGLHKHQKGQLLYAPKGCMNFALSDSICILPPTKAVWIPPDTVHRAFMTNVVAYRSLYFDCDAFSCPDAITIIEVSELLKALINKMAFWPADKHESEMTNYTALFWEEFSQSKTYSYELPLPTDRRLNGFRRQVSDEAFLAPDLVTLANFAGASPKTITRIFKAETGMSYQEWKQQWRTLKAIELLCRERQVSDVAHLLEFSSDSAFIAFFKKQIGQTPLNFMKCNAFP